MNIIMENLMHLTTKNTPNSFSHTVGVINGESICKLFEKNGDNIFKKNVRLYLGHTQAVNKQIIETIKKDPDWFFPYNNGITIETTKIINNAINNEVTFENGSVINGAQTLHCIYHVFKELKEEQEKKLQKNNDLSKEDREKILLNEIQKIYKILSNVKVLAKIIVVPTKNGVHSYLLGKYVNTQNAIKKSDYFSNQNNQSKIKDYLSDPIQSQFNLYYEIKRGEQSKFNKENKKTFNKPILRLENFNRNYCATFIDPGNNSTSSNKLFNVISNNGLLTIETPIDKLLLEDFHFTVKKMLFSQFLLDGIKEELTIFSDLYRSYKEFFIDNNSGDAIKVNKLFEKINHLEIKELRENIEWQEDALNQYDFFLKGKGKYVYGFFLSYFIQNLMNIQGINHFNETINKIENIQNLVNIKNNIKPLLYEVSKIIDPILKSIGKSENQITMSINSIIKDNIKKEIDVYFSNIKNINKFSNFNLY